MPTAPRVRAAAAAAIEAAGLPANPYLAALDDGGLSLDCFRRSQRQFYHAVAFFPRPMAALLSRLPDPADRLDVLHNLVEEHGDFRPERFHRTTFRRFLESVGADAPGPPGPAVEAFNWALAGCCGSDAVEAGVACLGVIELAFADVSARIGAAVVRRGWLAADRLVHYKLHAEIDHRHAEEFFAVVEPRWDEPAARAAVERGLRLGAYAFDRLYRDLAAG